MALKVDGGGSNTAAITKQNVEVKKAEVKTTTTTTTTTSVKNNVSNPETNGAVYANQDNNTQRADLIKARVNPQLQPTALRSTPTIEPEEAENKANEIISNNGGKDNLNTDAAGQQLAEIAKDNPADAQLIAQEIYSDDRIKEEDRDEIAQSFVQNLNDTELSEVASSAEGRGLLKIAEENLNQQPVHPDEAADATRVRRALDEHGIFLGSDQGIQYDAVDPVSISEDPNATPEEVASYIKNNPPWSQDENTARYAYLDAIQAHANDPDWLAQFHSALGAETAGQLISDTLNPGNHWTGVNGTDPELPLRQVELVRTTLETMVASGDLTQEGMNALIGSMPNGESAQYVATELFAHANDQTKEMFVNAAINDGNDTWDAGALHVLNTMPSYRQEQILNGLSSEKMNSFIEGAMARQEEIFSFTDQVKYGLYGTGVNEDLLDKVTFGGVEKLLDTANSVDVYYHAQTVVPKFSEELQLKLLNAVGTGLNNDTAFNNMENNVAFKDELSRLTINNHDAYIRGELNADGGTAGEDLSPAFRDSYEKIMQMTLFTPPLGEESTKLMEFVDSAYKGIADDLNQMSDADFEAKYGRNRAAMARAYGEMTGVFFKALDEGLTAVKDDAKKAAEVMGPIFKLIDFGVGQGLGKAGPIGKVISTVLDLTGASGAAQQAIKDKIENGQIEEAMQDLLDHGVDLSEMGERLYEEVHNNWLPNATDPNGTYEIPGGGSISIKDAWQNGYDHIVGAPQEIP